MKTCFKCSKTLPRSEFYTHSGMADGLLGKCKTCAKKDANTHRDRTVEMAREYDRMRYADESRRSAIRKRARAWALLHPGARKAEQAVCNAVRDGRMVRLPCVVCARADSHGHHADYSKPLTVTWLCPVHHAEQHQREGRMAIGARWPNDQVRHAREAQ